MKNNLKSNWNVINIIQPKACARRGLTMFHSKLDELTGANRYNPSGIAKRVRIACVKSRGRDKYQVIGAGMVHEGNFTSLKNVLREQDFTGIRMGAIRVAL